MPFFLAACGEDSGAKDSLAPTVVAVSLDDGAEGVLPDEVFTITFSEPMDTDAVEAAYASTELPPASVTFSWNAESTEVSITPNAPLPLETVHTLELAPTAADLAGNGLDAPFAVSFTTAGVEVVSVSLVSSLSGTEFDNSTNSSNLWIGDAGASGLQYMPVVSFNVGGLPEYALGIAEATLSGFQNAVSGLPYEELGGAIVASSVSFGALAAADLAFVHEELGVFSDSAVLGARLLDVTQAVRRDYDSRQAQEGLSQFRFLFDTPTNGDDVFDYATFEVDGFELEVTIFVIP